MKYLIVIDNIGRRSRKPKHYVCRRKDDLAQTDKAPIYEVMGDHDYLTEARERVATMNAQHMRQHAIAGQPSDGTWTANSENTRTPAWIGSKAGYVIAEVYGTSREERRQNAALISASKELLKSVSRMRAFLEEDSSFLADYGSGHENPSTSKLVDELVAEAEAAMAKAGAL